MSTNYIAPTWRMPRNANNTPVDKLSDYSIDFNGNEYVIIGSSTELDNAPSNPYSFSFWFKSSTAGDVLSEKRAVNNLLNAQYTIHLESGYIKWYGGADGITAGTQTSTTLIDDQWHHIVCVAESTTVNKIYVDGQLDVTSSADRINSAVVAGTFNIGANYGGSYRFVGQLSQYCIFDYALTDGTAGTPNQISYLYNLNNPMAIDGAEPIAYWPLGDNANPIATAGYPNISVGADSVFDFDSDVIEVSNSSALRITGNMTLSAWIKSNNISSNQILISKNGTGGRNYVFWLLGSKLRLNTATEGAYANSTLQSNTWYHVAVSVISGTGYFYVNGEPDGSSTFTVTPPATDQPFYIGRGYSPAAYDYFDGEMSNVQVWDAGLSPENITTLYNNGQPLMTGTQPEEANLKAWYKLNQSANWEADTVGEWQIPDAVSAYPQSFDFVQNKIIRTPNTVFDSIVTGSNKIGICTISYWFKNNNTGVQQDYMSLNDDNVSPAYFRIDSSNRILYQSKTNYMRYYAPSDINGWNHYCWVFNSDTSYSSGTPGQTNYYDNDLKFYLNGVEQQLSYNNSAAPNNTAWNGFNIAESAQASGASLNFKMSNLQLFDTNLNAPQVETLYNNGVPLPTASVQASNLKAWYKLNNSATFSTNWVVENSAITPNFDKAIDFISSNTQYIDLTNTGFPTGNAARTMSAWIKSDSTGQNNEQGIIKYGTTSTRQLFMMSLAATTGQLRVSTYGDDLTYTTADLRDDAWHHVALTYDGTSIKGYVDGSYVGVETNTLVNTTDNSPAIGNWAGAGFTFNGAISNVILYTETLTDANILTLYNNGTPQITPYGSPFGWWKLDDLITGIQDSGSGGNDGTLVNSPLLTSTDVRSGSGISSGMTEQNLVNNNVSTLNGESSGMDTTNLVQSNISKQIPFSSYSVEFDGLNYFSQVVFPEFELQTISYSVWFKRTGSLTGAVCLITQGSSSNKGWTCWLDNTAIRGQFGAGNNNSYNNSIVTSYKTYIPDNTWGNITATCDGTDQKIYVNGILRNTYTDIATIDYSSVVGFRIGERVAGSANFYGEISNPAVWDQVLTADDVLNIYNNGVTQDLNNFRIAPLAWWELGGKYTYWNGTDLVARSTSTGDFDVTGANTAQSQIVGTAPGSEANGTGTNLDLSDLIGDMKDSKINSYSINMADYADGVVNPANSGRSTLVP